MKPVRTAAGEQAGDEERKGPSREEIETLCVLYVIGERGCRAHDLAELLGLSPTLSAAVAQGMEPLILKGLLDREEDRFSLTEAGNEWLTRRLLELHVEEEGG